MDPKTVNKKIFYKYIPKILSGEKTTLIYLADFHIQAGDSIRLRAESKREGKGKILQFKISPGDIKYYSPEDLKKPLLERIYKHNEAYNHAKLFYTDEAIFKYGLYEINCLKPFTETRI